MTGDELLAPNLKVRLKDRAGRRS